MTFVVSDASPDISEMKFSDVVDSSLAILLEAKSVIDNKLKSSAADELFAMEKEKAAIDQRKAQLLALVGTAPAPVDELKERRTRKAGVAKFRNPANPEQTWTGRGKKPNWLTDPIEDCAIPLAEAA